MSIKCSLLGHRFGETTVEREREEDGSEVVITITELETCTRCGETRVVSENKEVTTMETPDDEVSGDTGDDSSAPDLGAATADSPDADVDADVPEDGDDAVILGEDDEESNAQAQARGDQATIPDAEASDSTDEGDADERDADDDDAVILGSDDSDPDAGSDAGADADDPDGETTGPGGAATSSGRTESEDAGADGPASDSEVGDSEEDAPTADQGGESGAWPEETLGPDASTGGDDVDDWPEETKRDVGADAGSAAPTIDENSSSITVPEGMFKCPNCGFTTEVESSPLRAGDFCPECHKGALLEHDDTTE